MEDYSWEILAIVVIVLTALSLLFGYLYRLYTPSSELFEVVKDQEESKHTSKPDISEPVISFVKTFKENPKRFTYTEENNRRGLSKKLVTLSTCKVLTDTFTKEVFKIEEVGLCTWWLDHPNIVLTKDEMDYINKEIVTPYKERKAKYVETVLNRRCVQENRKELQERRRLTKIYQ